ncbi:MAG TPA: multiprotein-bridging factor 1 family protein [Thermoplasmata archaeon]|nr:multiprotein-bridging factor 1 family protein [Thermoplasmata archaeon]
MCGNDVASLQRVQIEGSVLRLCAECSRFGAVLDSVTTAVGGPVGASTGRPGSIEGRLAEGSRRREERDLFRELPDMDLAPDWPKRVRVAREKLTWTPEELGKRLNEKKSVVLKIEAGAFRPPDAQIRKIELLLKVRLRADPVAEV